MSHVISLDPGKTTGVAIWNDDGVLQLSFNADLLEVFDALDVRYFGAIVYEDFRLQRHRAVQQSGSPMEASQVIGAAKFAAWKYDCQTYPQEVSVLTIASMHSGLQRPKNHAQGHHIDAVLHGYIWWEKQGVKPDIRVLSEEARPGG